MKKSLITISLLVAIFSNGCKSEKTKVSFATSKNMWCSLSLVAIEKNYFAEEGLDVTINYLEAGRFCMDAVLSKSADFGNVVDVNVGYLGFTPNENINIISEVSGALTSGIVARKSRGINSPKDLKNKNLAFSAGTTSDVFANRFLRKYNIPNDSVTLSKIQPKGIVAAMMAKDGPDAASTWEPFISNIKKALGDDAVVFEAPDIYTAREFVAARKDWASDHKDVTEAFLRAIKKADEFVKNSKEEAQQIVSKTTGLNIQLVKDTWDKYQIGFAFDEKTYLNEITRIGEDIIKQDDYKGKQIPDYSKFLNGSYFNKLDK